MRVGNSERSLLHKKRLPVRFQSTATHATATTQHVSLQFQPFPFFHLDFRFFVASPSSDGDSLISSALLMDMAAVGNEYRRRKSQPNDKILGMHLLLLFSLLAPTLAVTTSL